MYQFNVTEFGANPDLETKKAAYEDLILGP